MRLYRRMIKPVLSYPDHNYRPKYKDLESGDKWYSEDEEEQLREKYKHFGNAFEFLVFEEKYIALEAQEPRVMTDAELIDKIRKAPIVEKPTIDAIPVEWLKACGKHGSLIWVITDILIERWQKEQEAR